MMFFYAIVVTKATSNFYLEVLVMDRGLSVYDRLEQCALRGQVSCELNLYSRQIEKLVREGLAVQRGLPVPGWKGQYRCHIGWRYAVPNTVAWDLLETAANNSAKLKKALAEPNECQNICTGWNSDV